MKDEFKKEILDDFDRAKNALVSAKRNLKEGDIFTAGNRVFVACESALYARMKLKFGSVTFSRKKITLNMDIIDPSLKSLYERSYDMRVQADYGRRSRIAQLSGDNIESIIKNVETLLLDTENELKNSGIL